MSKLCIVRGFPGRTEHKGSFVNAHEDGLAGQKVVLDGYYPGFRYQGKNILHFYSTHPLRSKCSRLLPQFLYDRLVERRRTAPSQVKDSLQAFFQQHSVDVVLAEFGNIGADVCPHTTQLGIPLIVHFHGHDAHRASVVTEYRDRYQRMFAEAFRIITVSRYMSEALIALGADPGRIVLNPYGPNQSFFENQSSYDQVAVAVGRFTDIKAPQLTLLAFARALQSCPEARLVMGGHGELLEACQTLALALGIADRVTFPGAVRHEDVSALFRNARCFVQHSVVPTYGDAEGTPVAVLEAQAAGLPVVATRHAGIREAVLDGRTGYLVEERDVAGMTDRMIRLLKDQELARELGGQARTHVRESYSIRRHLSRIDQVVADARHQRGTPSATDTTPVPGQMA